jgi:uncharacterized RDD family membrane protein YckC
VPFRFGSVPLYLIARLIAVAIDLFAIAFAVATFGFHAFEKGFLLLAGRDEGGFATLASVSFGVAAFFAFVCESLFGTTLGKAIFGLRVRRTDGTHAGVVRIFVRYLLRPIDILVIGPLLALVTPRHQRLGDVAGGTVVSRSRIGPLASFIAVVLLAGIVYAEIVFGGGLESALGVTVEATNYGPDLVVKTAALAGITLAKPRTSLPFPAVATTPSPTPYASAAAAAVPTDDASSEATAAPTDDPDPDATATPSVEHI